MDSLHRYACIENVATIRVDDGKVNTMSIAMLEGLHKAFDQAEQDKAVVVLTGREGVFSSGFDLKVFTQGPEKVLRMLTLGADLCLRILSFPTPVIAACSGHALPLGALLLMSADARIGVKGAYKIGLNEVAIGLTLPFFAVEIARQRLTPSAFNRATLTSYMYSPEEAVNAGFLDEIVQPNELDAEVQKLANHYGKFSRIAFESSKLRVRQQAIDRIRNAVSNELTIENVKIALGGK